MRNIIFFAGTGLLLVAAAFAVDEKPKQPRAAEAKGPNTKSSATAAPRRKGATSEPAELDEAAGRQPSIRVDTNLVLINVTVTDPLNRFVTGLEAEHFKLFEEKAEQRIATFASEDAPLSVGLVFDASGSMGAKLQKARLAAAQFFKTANPDSGSLRYSW